MSSRIVLVALALSGLVLLGASQARALALATCNPVPGGVSCLGLGCNQLGATAADGDAVNIIACLKTSSTDPRPVWKSMTSGGGGTSYTYYCFNDNQIRWGGYPVCPATVTVGTQGPCDSGFKVSKALGVWGTCICAAPNFIFAFLPPGGSCGTEGTCPSGGSVSPVMSGQAFVCSQ